MTFMFCGNCGSQNPDGNKFCSGCGTQLASSTSQTNPNPIPNTQPQEAPKKERVFYKGEGELIVRTTKHHGAGRKVASFIVGAGVGYLIAGRDSKRTSKANGTIVITDRAIYCAGNDYPFDKILAVTVKGTMQKKIHLTLDKEVGAGGRGSSEGGAGRISVEIEISTKDIDGMFKGLEQARMSNVEF